MSHTQPPENVIPLLLPGDLSLPSDQQDGPSVKFRNLSEVERCEKDSTHFKDRVYKRPHRTVHHEKPYDPIDKLDFSKLKISHRKSYPVTKLVAKSNTYTAGMSQIPKTCRSILKPAKLSVKVKKETCDYLDFRSLANEIKELSSPDVEKELFNWNELRDSLPNRARDDSVNKSCANDSLDVDKRTQKQCPLPRSCSQEAKLNELEFNAEELAFYFDELVHIPRKMSKMAEMMYT